MYNVHILRLLAVINTFSNSVDDDVDDNKPKLTVNYLQW